MNTSMQTVVGRVLRHRYVDSVVLMRLATQLIALEGVIDAAAMMGTAANRGTLLGADYDIDEVRSAQPDDLVVAVKANNVERARAALSMVESLLEQPPSAGSRITTIADAVHAQPSSNLVSISLPGEFAAAQARDALDAGLNVFLFSSNVTVDDEILLKKLAAQRGLLCMGPDCGTAIIGGAGLGFANALERGPVGIVAASGTGAQAVSCLLDRQGVGVSHVIGVGSRDLTDAIGGLATVPALQALLDDDATEVVILISKPPGEQTSMRLRSLAATASKPVITCFLGDPRSRARTLDEAAFTALDRLGIGYERRSATITYAELAARRSRLGKRRYIRGLYSGGTLAAETQLVLGSAGIWVHSNSPLHPELALPDPVTSIGHTILDLGSEEFVRGRPHPMIDPRQRVERLRREAADPGVAVILFDVVLGYNASPNPAGDLAESIRDARRIAATDGGDLSFVASVVGTNRDPQDLATQERILRESGVLLAPTNAAAARLATSIVDGSRP